MSQLGRVAAFVLLVLAATPALAGPFHSPRLSYELLEWPQKEFISLIGPEVSLLDEEGAGMLLAMMGLGGLEEQVWLITALNCFDTPDGAGALASYAQHFVDTLVKEGFEREDAIRIFVNMGPPKVPPGK